MNEDRVTQQSIDVYIYVRDIIKESGFDDEVLERLSDSQFTKPRELLSNEEIQEQSKVAANKFDSLFAIIRARDPRFAEQYDKRRGALFLQIKRGRAALGTDAYSSKESDQDR